MQIKQSEESTAQTNGHCCNVYNSNAHYIGVDVGTDSARACIINHEGDVLGYVTEDIHQWQSQGEDFYVSSHIIFRALKTKVACRNNLQTTFGEVLVSLIATTCNMPVITPRYSHTAVCHGAAILAAKAATTDCDGNTEDIWSVMKHLGKPGRLFEPNDDEGMKNLLAVKYKVFLEQCERQRVFRSMVDQVLTKETPRN